MSHFDYKKLVEKNHISRLKCTPWSKVPQTLDTFLLQIWNTIYKPISDSELITLRWIEEYIYITSFNFAIITN